MLKWLPKSMKMVPKIDLEPTLGSKFSFWEAFGAMQKYHEFLVPFWRPEKSEKWAQGEAKRRFGTHEVGPSIAFLRIWAPGAAPFRAREYLVPRYKGYKVQGTKVQGYKASSKRKQGYFKGSNTPKGQRPGELGEFSPKHKFHGVGSPPGAIFEKKNNLQNQGCHLFLIACYPILIPDSEST